MSSKPYIVVQVSTSVDSRMALGPNRTWWDDMADPRVKAAEPLGADLWREVENKINAVHKPQANMQGCGSFVKEGEELRPLPAVEGDIASLYQDYLPDEIVHRPDHRAWLVVVDGRGRLRLGYKGDDNPGTYMLHLTSHAAPPEYLAFLQREKIPYLISGERHVDLPAAMLKLNTQLGVKCMVSTAGGKLNGALLRAGLVDELNLIMRPELIGGTATPTLFDSPELEPDELPTRLELISAHVQADGCIYLRYRVLPPRRIELV